jgi:hypothetical protein
MAAINAVAAADDDAAFGACVYNVCPKFGSALGGWDWNGELRTPTNNGCAALPLQRTNLASKRSKTSARFYAESSLPLFVLCSAGYANHYSNHPLRVSYPHQSHLALPSSPIVAAVTTINKKRCTSSKSFMSCMHIVCPGNKEQLHF